MLVAALAYTLAPPAHAECTYTGNKGAFLNCLNDQLTKAATIDGFNLALVTANADFVSSAVRQDVFYGDGIPDAGMYLVSFDVDAFDQAPVCTCTVLDTGASPNIFTCTLGDVSGDSIEVRTWGPTTPRDTVFALHCVSTG